MAGYEEGNLLEPIGATRVEGPPSSPAAARKHFEVPNDLPVGYTPPEYRSIEGARRIGLDIETLDPGIEELGPGAHRKDGHVVGVAIGYSASDASYYPTGHEVGPNVENPDKFYERLRHEAKSFEGEIVGANLQYDLDWLRARHGVVFPKAKFRDVQIAEPLLDENLPSYKLGILSRKHVGKDKVDSDLRKKYGGGYISNMHRVHPEHAAIYGEGDVTLPWEILDKQLTKLESEDLLDLFYMESALTPLLLEMRSRGVRVDVDKAEQSKTELYAERSRIEEQINQLAQTPVDIWSSDSIAHAFDNLKLEYPRTKTGKASFVKAWLNAHDSEIAKLIVRARESDKIAGTFIDSYILKGHVDGRLHCMFNQLKSDDSGTVSGRFSSSNPNLQNIPSRHPVLGPLMRSMFVPEEGMLWGSLDWSQIEYRLLVHYASISKGIDADEAVRMYRNDSKTDFHQMAAELTGLERKQVKSINFGVVYGMGVPTLANNLGVTMSEANAIMNQFHENSPFIKMMLDRTAGIAGRRGWIKTVLGRRRRFNMWELRDGDSVDYVSDEKLAAAIEGKDHITPRRAFTHKALNALLQGSAADLMKKAMVDSWEAGIWDVLVPHLTVHDELNASVPDTKEGHEAFEELRRIMETSLTLDIPVLADGTMGRNWDEAKG